MKIVFFIDSMPKGGAERVIANLSNYLSLNKKNEVVILTLIKQDCAYELNSRVKYDTLDIEVGKKSFFKKIKSIFTNIGKYKLRINEYNPDLVVSFLPRASYYSAISKKKGYKLIISERNDPYSIYKGFVKKTITKLLYNRADGLVFQTKGASTFFFKRSKKPYSIIENPVNSIFLIDPYYGERKKVIVNLGRLAPQKNQKLLIEAFKVFSEKYKEYKLFIYGDGPLKDELNEYIKSNNLEKKVFLRGVIDDVKKEIYDSAAFVLTSNYEGMPNALMEAMAMGIPCISTDCPCGGPRELIDDNCGMLIDNGSVEQLVESLNKIVSDNDFSTNISKNASKKMRNYSVEKINKKWEEFFKKIMKG